MNHSNAFMLILLLSLAIAEKCAYKKYFVDDQCTQEDLTFYWRPFALNSTCSMKKATPGRYGKATCDADGTNIKVWDYCNSATCDDSDHANQCPSGGEIPDPLACEHYIGDIYVMWVCVDCTTLDCGVEYYAGSKANPECLSTTKEPLESDMCVYIKKYTDATCETEAGITADIAEDTIVMNKDCLSFAEQGLSTPEHYMGTCNSDGTSIRTWERCESDTCNQGWDDRRCPPNGDDKDTDCEEDRDGLYEKYVCEPCRQVDCLLDLADGMDANPSCMNTSGAPIQAETCLVNMYYTDAACETVDASKNGLVYDSSCRQGNTILTNLDYIKGECTMDNTGNLLTARKWETCDDTTCVNPESGYNNCPAEGLDIFGERDSEFQADCTFNYYFQAGFHQYKCMKCNEIPCEGVKYFDGSAPAHCGSGSNGNDNSAPGSEGNGSSASTFTMTFGLLFVALLF